MKIKSQVMLHLVASNRKYLSQENKELKEIQIKYEENALPEEYAKQLKKFLRTNQKNLKNVIKGSLEIVEPIFNELI